MDGVFDPDFIADLRWWILHDPTTADDILILVEAALASPRYGLGDPYLLKDRGNGFWARRINEHHLLVYVHYGTHIHFLQCRTLEN